MEVNPDRDAILRSMTRSARRVLLRTLPGAPEHGKWTKLGPALDWHGLNMLFSPWLEKLTNEGLKAIKVVDAIGEEQGDGVLGELHWHAVAGVRAKQSKILVASREDKLNVMGMLVTFFPVRYLTTWFLHRSSEHRPTDARPALLDLLTLSSSPGLVALQYLSYLHTGEAPMLQFVFVAFGVASFYDLAHIFPEGARKLIALIRVVAAWTDRRVVLKFKKYPEQIGKVADPSLDVAERIGLSVEFSRKRACCVGLTGRQIQASMSHDADLASEAWVYVIYWWIWVLSWALTVADIERRHKRSRLIASSHGVTFENFRAVSIIKETESIARTDRLLASKPPVEATPPSQGNLNKRVKAMSALELHRRDAWAEIRGNAAPWWEERSGESKSARMARFNMVQKGRFAALDDASKRYYENAARVSAVQAFMERQKRSEALCLPSSGALVSSNADELAAPRERTSVSRATEALIEAPVDLPAASTQALVDTTHSDLPLHPAQYLAARSERRTQKEFLSQFKRESAQVGTDKGKVSDSTRYFKPCGATCIHDIDPGSRWVVDRTTLRITQIRDIYNCSPQNLPLYEVLIAVHLRLPTREGAYEERLVALGILTTISAQSGHHKPTFSINTMEKRSGPDDDQQALWVYGIPAQLISLSMCCVALKPLFVLCASYSHHRNFDVNDVRLGACKCLTKTYAMARVRFGLAARRPRATGACVWRRSAMSMWRLLAAGLETFLMGVEDASSSGLRRIW